MSNKIKRFIMNTIENPDNSANVNAINAGYMPNKDGSVNTGKIKQSEAFQRILAQIDDNKILRVVNEAFDANKAYIVNDGKIDGSPVSHLEEVPDHSIRLKTVEVVSKLKGYLNPDTHIEINNNNSINSNTIDRLNKAKARLSKLE